MRKINYYTQEQAKEIINSNPELKEFYEKVRVDYELDTVRVDCGLEYCGFWENWDSDDDISPICISWENDCDAYGICVNTLEQAVAIVNDIEKAQGKVRP